MCHHRFDICSPAIQAYPSFLEANKYQDITEGSKTPFQKAFNTDLATFGYIAQQPKLFTAMQLVMTAMQSSDWLGAFDLLDEARSSLSEPEETERPFFVDVGGGHGHQLVQLRDKYPHLKGRLVLQDLPQAVEQLSPVDGVQAIAQDFFEKQKTDGNVMNEFLFLSKTDVLRRQILLPSSCVARLAGRRMHQDSTKSCSRASS